MLNKSRNKTHRERRQKERAPRQGSLPVQPNSFEIVMATHSQLKLVKMFYEMLTLTNLSKFLGILLQPHKCGMAEIAIKMRVEKPATNASNYCIQCI